MGKLIYGMIMSLDGYVEDKNGKFGWGAPEDPEVHSYINKLSEGVGTYLYGRAMYDTMVWWETALEEPDMPDFIQEYARIWQAANKIVFSGTMTEARSKRTRIVPVFDAELVRQLKRESTTDFTIDGPTIAAQALRAGLIDELQLTVAPAVVGGGKRFFPDDVALNLELIDEKRFSASGVVISRYNVLNDSASRATESHG
jgi:dihydrofolate reductase